MKPFTQLCQIEQFCEDPSNFVFGQFWCLLADVRVLWQVTHGPESGRHPYAVAKHLEVA